MSEPPIGAARKWAITFSVMLVTVMQVLDTSITNVALSHMQGSFSASLEEMSWVITSYLAANAIVIPASGWLTSVFGRRRAARWPPSTGRRSHRRRSCRTPTRSGSCSSPTPSSCCSSRSCVACARAMRRARGARRRRRPRRAIPDFRRPRTDLRGRASRVDVHSEPEALSSGAWTARVDQSFGRHRNGRLRYCQPRRTLDRGPATDRDGGHDDGGERDRAGGRAQIHLMGVEGTSSLARGPEQDPTRPHVALAVPETQEARRELERLGVPYWSLKGVTGPGAEQIFVTDPAGNMVELHQAGTCRCSKATTPPRT